MYKILAYMSVWSNTKNAQTWLLRFCLPQTEPRERARPQDSEKTTLSSAKIMDIDLICIIHLQIVHRITQHPPLSLFSNVSKAARVAASNTSSTPCPVKDEHSRYFRAPMSRAAFMPSFSVVNFKDFLRISSCATWSSLRSFLRPTKIIGTPGHRSFASSTH